MLTCIYYQYFHNFIFFDYTTCSRKKEICLACLHDSLDKRRKITLPVLYKLQIFFYYSVIGTIFLQNHGN